MATWARTVHDFANGETVTDVLMDALPKGAQLIATSDSDTTGITGTQTTVASHSFTALTARRYLICFSVDIVAATANDLAQARVLLNGATILAAARSGAISVTGDNGRVTLAKSFVINIAAGSNTVALQVARENGSGTGLTAKANAELDVIDISTFS